MKKRLNANGINKLISYLGENRFSIQKLSGKGDLMLGSLSESDFSKVNEIGVVVEHIGAGLHEVYHISEQNVDDNQNSEKNDLDEMISKLSEVFPTREEVNQALNNLQAKLIDPEEMVNNLKSQIKSIEKQSRSLDEIG